MLTNLSGQNLGLDVVAQLLAAHGALHVLREQVAELIFQLPLKSLQELKILFEEFRILKYLLKILQELKMLFANE